MILGIIDGIAACYLPGISPRQIPSGEGITVSCRRRQGAVRLLIIFGLCRGSRSVAVIKRNLYGLRSLADIDNNRAALRDIHSALRRSSDNKSLFDFGIIYLSEFNRKVAKFLFCFVFAHAGNNRNKRDRLCRCIKYRYSIVNGSNRSAGRILRDNLIFRIRIILLRHRHNIIEACLRERYKCFGEILADNIRNL